MSYMYVDPAESISGPINKNFRARFECSESIGPRMRRLVVAVIPATSRYADRFATFLVPFDLTAEGYAACRRELWKRMENGESLEEITSWFTWMIPATVAR